jgi:hypothetical protein
LASSHLCGPQITEEACLKEEMVNPMGDFRMVEQRLA